jgi:hypothetical protein
MAGPIVFISRSRVKEGRLEELRALFATATARLEADKPRTLAFLAYLREDHSELAIVHVFADSDSFAVHLEGAGERSQTAYQFIETIAFEILGQPGDAEMESMRQAAARAGVALKVEPEYATGFLRLGAG